MTDNPLKLGKAPQRPVSSATGFVKPLPAQLMNGDLASVVDELCAGRRKVQHSQPLPSGDAVIETVETLRTALFPGYYGRTDINAHSMRYHVGVALDRVMIELHEQIRRGLCFAKQCQDDPRGCAMCEDQSLEITKTFLAQLPAIRRMLDRDVQAAFRGDPAATSPDEAVFCYPGVLGITSYRLAHALHGLGVPLIPRMITEYAHSQTGIDIHHGAEIGDSFFIDHGTGVVIGETSIIGDRVRLYQGVTLGAKSFLTEEDGSLVRGIARHPVVEDDVIIYAGATILGRVTIGKNSIIGGNVWLTKSIPPGSRISQAQARQTIFEEGAGI